MVETAAAAAADAEAAKKEALRKAGQDYFETILAKAAAGRDPFVADAAARRRPADVEAVDPDMETVGLVLKGAKLYFIGTLFIAASTMQLLFVSVSHSEHSTAASGRPGQQLSIWARFCPERCESRRYRRSHLRAGCG